MEQLHTQRESTLARAIPQWRAADDVAKRNGLKQISHRELRRFLRIEALLSRSTAAAG